MNATKRDQTHQNKMKNEQKKHSGKIIISISNKDAQMPSRASVASQGPE